MTEQSANISKVRDLVEQSSRIVMLLGVGTVIESGGINVWSSKECYRIEDKYHQSPDEMMSVGFYSARRDRFFNFYKAEILSRKLTPAPLYYYIKRLQDRGKIKKIITQNYYGIHEQVGIRDVVELHGNIHNNSCPHCGKSFSLEYVLNSKSVPLCDNCGSTVRPGICLFGEKISNDRMTEAVNACEDADLIMVLGSNMYDNMVQYCTGTYKGDQLVLITKEEHYTDKYADYVIHGLVSDIMKQIVL